MHNSLRSGNARSVTRTYFAAALCLSIFACECSKPTGNSDGGGGGVGGGIGGGEGGGAGGGMGGGSGGGGGDDAGVIVDPNDPANTLKDSDCDGLTDAEEFGNIYAGGQRTSPANPDTDGDGILDGVEAGRMSSVDPRCTNYPGDADPASRTNPTAGDTDGDGINDGLEDVDHNGRAEPTETDATNPDTDFDGIDDGVEDANKNGAVDTGETDPRKRDTDGDFIADGIEKTLTMTDPLKADTDSDTCIDSAEDANQNGRVDTGETSPNNAMDCGPANNPDSDMDGLPNRVEDKNGNGMVDAGETDPNNADTDGDGLRDGIEDANKNGSVDAGETNPLRKDTDCDGLLDGPTAGNLRGEDQNANGTVDMGETDPRRRDTDGDGITDGVEVGVTAMTLADPTTCLNVPVDLDPGTTTNPNNRDSDGDGIDDGAEDTNQNGRVDAGELNPNNMADGTGPAGRVCTQMNLRPVVFKSEADPDLQLGLPATFTEISTMTVGGTKRGLIGYDPVNKVAFVAWRQAAPSGATNPTQDEAGLNPTLAGVGALTNPTTQTFTSWDNMPALQAFYDMAGAADVKDRANAIANAMVGAGAGALMGTGGATGPFKLQVEYLHRTNSAVVVVVALTPLATYNGAPLFVMSDTAGGSGVAQFGDFNAYQCETFAPRAGAVDFLVVVDDSCSMASSQQALADAASAMATALGNSTLDWRVALVTSEYHLTGTNNNRSVRRGFTRNINQFRAWLTQNSACGGGNTCSGVPAPLPACDSNGADPNGANGGCWVGTSGSGSEGLLGAARKAVDDITVLPLPMTEQVNRVRAGAQLVVILLGDADDQTNGYTAVGTPYENIQNFITFFTNSGTGTKNRLNVNIPVHGIVCPAGANCNGETQSNPQRHAQVITATGGIRGAINNTTSIQTSMAAIVTSSIAAAGYRMQKPPIGASVKVAMDAVLDGMTCNKDDIPRSRTNGFDFDGINRTISFFGSCRPAATTMAAAVSYRYWIDTTPNPGGNPPPCNTDTYYDPTDPDFCRGRLACNFQSNTCECPANCGGTPPPGMVCDTNRLVCDYVCTQDCGGTCSQFQQCNVTSCSCECRQTASCPVGYRFQNGAGVCGCVCDTAALNCGPTYNADPMSCSCVCKPNCGGCGANEVCNPSTCACTGGIN